MCYFILLCKYFLTENVFNYAYFSNSQNLAHGSREAALERRGGPPDDPGDRPGRPRRGCRRAEWAGA